MAVPEAGGGVDHDLTAGSIFDVGDEFLDDVGELVFGEAGVTLDVCDDVEFDVVGVAQAGEVVGLRLPVFVGSEEMVDAGSAVKLLSLGCPGWRSPACCGGTGSL
jgi:hypothetical protein